MKDKKTKTKPAVRKPKFFYEIIPRQLGSDETVALTTSIFITIHYNDSIAIYNATLNKDGPLHNQWDATKHDTFRNWSNTDWSEVGRYFERVADHYIAKAKAIHPLRDREAYDNIPYKTPSELDLEILENWYRDKTVRLDEADLDTEFQKGNAKIFCRCKIYFTEYPLKPRKPF